MTDDPPPTLGYAPVEPEAAWSDGDDAYFEFHPPSPIVPLLERSFWLALTTVLTLVMGNAAVAIWSGGWRRTDLTGPDLIAPAIVVTLMCAAAVYWTVCALRSLVRAARFRDASIVIEFSPGQLRVENPIDWGDVSLVWKRAEVYSAKLQEVGFTIGFLKEGFSLSVEKSRTGQQETVRFRSNDGDAIDRLRDALDRFVPRR